MSASLSIILPFQTDNGPRERVFQWVRSFYQHQIKHADVCIGESQGSPFCKAAAVNDGADKAGGDVLAIIDSDIICPPAVLQKAVRLLTQHPWVIPYTEVRNLTRPQTDALLKRPSSRPFPVQMRGGSVQDGKQLPYGGINVLLRSCFFQAGGFDERFIGWGGEDDAFACAVDTLCGPHERIPGAVFHLHHPSSKGGRPLHYRRNAKLAHRYCSAYGNTHEMKKILNEKSSGKPQ
ncbi:glycosyltransferase family 2 protein [Salibacterium sp. K-3]